MSIVNTILEELKEEIKEKIKSTNDFYDITVSAVGRGIHNAEDIIGKLPYVFFYATANDPTDECFDLQGEATLSISIHGVAKRKLKDDYSDIHKLEIALMHFLYVDYTRKATTFITHIEYDEGGVKDPIQEFVMDIKVGYEYDFTTNNI